MFINYNRKPPSYYANLYKQYNIQGAHVIKLGPNNDEAAKEALSTWPGQKFNKDFELEFQIQNNYILILFLFFL